MIFTFLKFEYSVYVGMSVNVIMEHTKKVVCNSFFSRTWEDGLISFQLIYSRPRHVELFNI